MGPMGPLQRTGAFYRPISESAWAKPDPRRPGGSIFMAIFPKKKFTKDRPRHHVDDEHHVECGPIATRNLDSANARLQREGLWPARTVPVGSIMVFAGQCGYHAVIFVASSTSELLLRVHRQPGNLALPNPLL